MPGFGKSGTVRIIFFRLSTNNSPLSIFNVEAPVAPARLQVGFIHCRDLRVSRAAPQLCTELGDGVGCSFGNGLDGAVGEIPHASGYAQAVGGADRKEAIADALHPAFDDE